MNQDEDDIECSDASFHFAINDTLQSWWCHWGGWSQRSLFTSDIPAARHIPPASPVSGCGLSAELGVAHHRQERRGDPHLQHNHGVTHLLLVIYDQDDNPVNDPFSDLMPDGLWLLLYHKEAKILSLKRSIDPSAQGPILRWNCRLGLGVRDQG